MDDILYIIIGILWVVFSLYNHSAKKKKQAQKSAPVPEKPVSDPMTILRDLLMEEKESEPAPEFVPVEVKPPVRAPGKRDEKFNQEGSYIRDYALDFSKEGQKATSAVLTEEEFVSDRGHIADGFDLRKAFIYSEILRTPYI